MLIKFNHPNYTCLELRGETLIIHSMQGETRVLQENIKDAAVTVQGNRIRIVAFLDKDYAWFLYGTEDLKQERLEFGQPYMGGGRLVNDGLGNSHLFYFVKQSSGYSALLRHQIFGETWSIPQLVSTNVFPERTSFNASWHSDQYLHLVYCSYKDQRLLYRVYNLEHRTWSGAVIVSQERCNRSHFISADKLYLFWEEEGKHTNLKVRLKQENWGAVTLVSTGDYHASNVGYSNSGKEWSVLWGEGSKFYQAPFDHWSDRQEVERNALDYAWVVLGDLTLPVYDAKQKIMQETARAVEVSPETREMEPVLQTTEALEVHTEVLTQERERKKRQREEAELQAAFVEQAFRTLQEWEKVREEMQRWQREFRLPESVDLTPFTLRLERLERRFLTLQQGQEQSKKRLDVGLEQLEQELGRVRARLRDLEDCEKRKQVGLWRRVLGKS